MELAKTYSPKEVEDKWYEHWLKNKFFSSKPDKNKEPYTIVIPPPNVTGVLHMGHGLNNTIQDVLIRRARMQGKNACWVPGTDHASIATEAKVVAMLQEKGIDKKKLSREDFLNYAWEWKNKYGGIILQQLKKLGASCDWDRTAFTMDDDYYQAVIHIFVDLYNKGLIYRGVRMINWDPKAKTALSDEEVIFKEVNSKLYFLKYFLDDGTKNFITIATTRPETILGDTALCVHPNDERYKNLKGKKALVPLINRSIPIIEDEYVTMEFGTGAPKVTPAHDLNDYHLGIKHKLETIDIFNEDGTFNEQARLYVGEDRFKVRKKIVEELEAKGHLVKIEEIKNNIGYSERTHEVIEPKLSLQWFLKMNEMSKSALEVVINDEIKFFPPKFKNMYRHWMENIKDWCISRQLWWGQRIPAWYLPDGEFVVAENTEQALKIANKNGKWTIDNLKQDEDVLDTWFSSWLWPIEVFKGITQPNNDDLNYYYPTSTLVTAPEIIFFWVARMIMSGLEYQKEIPFKNVYFTGIVRDKQGKKMSKSIGNSPDMLELIDKYGADGVRFGILVCSPAGNDLLFDEKLCEQGRNFCNKLWNALRLIKGWTIAEVQNSEPQSIAIDWFENKLNAALSESEKQFELFNLSEAQMTIYKLIWDDFCSWYLEMVKPEFGQPIDKNIYDKTIEFFEQLLKLLHPFMPFVTEEIYHLLKERDEKDCILVASFPKQAKINSEIISQGEKTKEIISKIRELKNQNNIKQKEELSLFVSTNDTANHDGFKNVISKLANLKSFEKTDREIQNSLSFVVKQDRFFILTDMKINVEQEKIRLMKELEYNVGFQKSVHSKLSNEKFVANAKAEVLEKERQKLADADAKIKILEETLAKL